MERAAILETAAVLIDGARDEVYGPPAENFARIAQLWAPIFGHPVTPEQVALCMAQVKIARLVNSPSHADSWIDAAGYLACGGEIATG